MRVLIIGGTGLISTPMTRSLRERGDDITVYNRGRSDKPLPPDVRQMQGDRTDYAAFEAQMQAAGAFDVVIDMVCYRPADAESLSRAFAGRAGQLIVCSTVDVYTKTPSRYPIRETESHAPTQWDYSQDKARLEALLWAASGRGDFPLTILRPAHTYNEGGALLHSLGGGTTYLDRLRRGKPIVVHGDGNSLWCSCFADDVAQAFVTATGASVAFNKSYNLAGEEWLTWNRIHEIVANALGGPPPPLVHIPTDLLAKMTDRAHISAINFQYNNVFDNGAARDDLNFQYTVPFAEGARRVIANLDARGKIENSDNDPLDDRLIAAWQSMTEALPSQADAPA